MAHIIWLILYESYFWKNYSISDTVSAILGLERQHIFSARLQQEQTRLFMYSPWGPVLGMDLQCTNTVKWSVEIFLFLKFVLKHPAILPGGLVSSARWRVFEAMFRFTLENSTGFLHSQNTHIIWLIWYESYDITLNYIIYRPASWFNEESLKITAKKNCIKKVKITAKDIDSLTKNVHLFSVKISIV